MEWIANEKEHDSYSLRAKLLSSTGVNTLFSFFVWGNDPVLVKVMSLLEILSRREEGASKLYSVKSLSNLLTNTYNKGKEFSVLLNGMIRNMTVHKKSLEKNEEERTRLKAILQSKEVKLSKETRKLLELFVN